MSLNFLRLFLLSISLLTGLFFLLGYFTEFFPISEASQTVRVRAAIVHCLLCGYLIAALWAVNHQWQKPLTN